MTRSIEQDHSNAASSKAEKVVPTVWPCPECLPSSLLKRAALTLLHRTRLLSFFSGYTRNTATVFMLHRIAPAGMGGPGRFSADQLDQFLVFLKKNDYSVISLEEWIEALEKRKPTFKTVVLTVDDGYFDFYADAFPVLRSHSVPATVFIATDFIDGKLFYWWDRLEHAVLTSPADQVDLTDLDMGTVRLPNGMARCELIGRMNYQLKLVCNETRQKILSELIERLEVPYYETPVEMYRPMTWNQIREITEHSIDFHSHTRTHPIMTSLSYEEKCEELTHSREILKERINKRSEIFCYPNGEAGFFDEESIRALKETGYRAAVTGVPGFDVTTETVDLYRLHRIAIPMRLDLFEQYVGGFERLKEKFRGASQGSRSET